ncbi:unnamed protein product, partial [Rotaria sordida]
MLASRCTILLVVYSIVSVHVFYYTARLQIKKTPSSIINIASRLIPISSYNQSSDNHLNTSNSTETNPTVGFKSANILHNLTINNSNINITFNLTTIIQTTTLPTILISFLNASFYSSFNFTTSSLDINNSLPICNFSISNNNTSIYQVTINQTL